MVTVCDSTSVPSSNNVELNSVSVVLLMQVSVGCEWTLVSVFSIGDTSREMFVLSGIFVLVNG